MPINDETTVLDVEIYFETLAEKLKQQQRDIELEKVD